MRELQHCSIGSFRLNPSSRAHLLPFLVLFFISIIIIQLFKISIIPNICGAISSVTLTRTRFNKAINQTLTRRRRPFRAAFGWLGSGADAAHGIPLRKLRARWWQGGECPPLAPPGTILHLQGSHLRPGRGKGNRPPRWQRLGAKSRACCWLCALCLPPPLQMPHVCPEPEPGVGLRAPPLAAKALTAPASHSKRKISLCSNE